MPGFGVDGAKDVVLVSCRALGRAHFYRPFLAPPDLHATLRNLRRKGFAGGLDAAGQGLEPGTVDDPDDLRLFQPDQPVRAELCE
jgi:hypothetical protein